MLGYTWSSIPILPSHILLVSEDDLYVTPESGYIPTLMQRNKESIKLLKYSQPKIQLTVCDEGQHRQHAIEVDLLH